MHSSFLFAGILPLVAAEACSSVVAKTHLVTSVITTVEYTTLPSGPRCTLSHAIPSESPSGEAPPPAEESSTFEWVPPPRPSGTDFEWLPSLEPTSGEPILTTSLTPVKPSSPSSDNSEKPVPTSQPQASETSGNDYSSGTTDVSEPTGSSPASHSDVASSDSPVPTSASEKPSAPASESEPCTTSTASDSSPSSSVTTASEKPSAPASESEPCTTSTASDSSPSSAVTTASEKPSAPASESEPCTTTTGESSPSSAVTSASEKPSAPASESEPCTTSTGEASPSSASDKTSATASESEPCTTSASETAHNSAEESVTTTKPSSGATTTSAEESSEATTTSAEESSAASTSAEESAEITTSAKESSATSAAATSEVSSKTSEAPSTFSSVVTTSATTSKASTTSKAPASTTSKAPEETKPARAYPADIVDDLQDESMDNLKRWLSENNANGCTLEKASVRREWGDLSLEQREDYISAVLCLQSAPARYSSEIPGAKSRFDDFVVAHQAQTNYIHGTANFLTWHRYFLHEFEKALKGECGYKGAMPYWNWDRYANDPENSPLFNGDAGSLGGNSGASGCVETGPFKNYVVNIGPGPSTRHNPRCLRRSISKVAARYTKVDISYPLITQSNSVVQFQDRLQSGNNVHASGHHTVGGNPGADIYTSPGDPYFHLHHAGVDRLYFIWQLQDLNSRLSQVGGTNGQTGRSGSLTERMNLGRNAGDVELGSLLNTMGGLNGDLCYIYY